MSHTIALVDDDRNILTSVSIALEAEGFRVQTYADGDEALRSLTARPVDLAILDIKMPRMDGVELLKRLRGRVRLFLLTRGDPARQRAKIAQCGLGPYFEDVVIRSMEAPGTKRDDIEAILGRTQIPPSRCAVVGDDPADELRFAQELGCTAIQVPETPLSEVAETLILGGLLSVS